MSLNELIKRGIVRSPDDPAVPGAVDPATPAPAAEPQYFDLDNEIIQEEVERLANERAERIAEERYNARMTEFQRQQVPQYQQPQYQPPQPKTPEETKREARAKIASAATWEESIDAMTDLVFESEQRAYQRAMSEVQPLIQHSAVQSATSTVLKHVPNVPEGAKRFIDQAISDLKFRPQDLDNPQNAQFVADAAEMRAIRAGALQAGAPSTPHEAPRQATQAPRQPVAAPAPVSTPTTATWRDGLTQEQQEHIENTMRANTPRGMDVAQVWSEKDIAELKNAVMNPFESMFR